MIVASVASTMSLAVMIHPFAGGCPTHSVMEQMDKHSAPCREPRLVGVNKVHLYVVMWRTLMDFGNQELDGSIADGLALAVQQPKHVLDPTFVGFGTCQLV